MTITAATAPEVDPTKPPPAEYLPDYDQFVTEDDAPVDNFFSEKQQRLLTEPLYSARTAERLGRPLLAAANVGVFYGEGQPAIVPDALVSLDVELAADLWPKANRSYFIWRFGKPPDAVVEIVSNREGGELERKRERYARLGVARADVCAVRGGLAGGHRSGGAVMGRGIRRGEGGLAALV
jgi:Uma2 family endonuclease